MVLNLVTILYSMQVIQDIQTTSTSRLGSPKYAFIPIGAYDPEWFMAESHVNPEDAVQIMLDLGVENSFECTGNFKLTDEDTLEPKERLDK